MIMFRIEHNVETGEIIKIQLTAAEIEQLQEFYVESIAKSELAQAEAQIKATARRAILDRLGLTQEEAALLLS